MSTPPPKKKKPTTRNLQAPPPAGARRKKGKKKKKKANPLVPQIVGGLTLLAVVGGVGGVSVYMAQRTLPEVEPVEVSTTPALPRPSITPTLGSRDPKRPGLVAMMPDEVYYPGATDVKGTAIEPPVMGLLGRGVITVFADGAFRPKEPVTRAQFVSWCYNAVMAQSVPGEDPFAPVKKPFNTVRAQGDEFGDVAADHWAADVLATVKKSGVLGTTTNYFQPDAPLTREGWLELASLFAATTEAKAGLASPVDEGKLKVAYRAVNYTDYDQLKSGLKPYAWFVFGDDKRKLWIGEAFTPPTNPGPWQPAKPMTRGEVAAWIGGVYEQIGNGAF